MRLPVGAPVAAVLACALLAASTLVSAEEAVTREAVDRALAALDKSAQAEIERNAVPGLAVAVVFQDEVVFAKGYGVRDTRGAEKVDADTVFQLASVSKPIGSTVIARLVGEGVVSWDSRIGDLDPSFQMMEPWVTSQITVRDFYCHRSGLPAHAGDLLEDVGFGREEVLRRLRYQAPASSFRSRYAYTNFGMTEAAVAAAKAAGMDWADLSWEKLYLPLGMSSTSSRYSEFISRPNKALGHVLIDGKWVHREQRQPDAQSPAGGVSSSVNDLTNWIRLQMGKGRFEGKEIVAETALAETHLPMIITGLSPLNGLPGFYGLGWNVNYGEDGRHRISHSGGFAMGAGTNVNISLDDRLGIVVLTNGAANGVAEGLAANFIDDALHGAPTRDWIKLYTDIFAKMAAAETSTEYDNPPASPSPAAPNAAYLGTYSNDFFGDLEIAEKDGGLVMVVGPGPMAFPMTHYDRDIFTFETKGENATGVRGITFTLGPDGKATDVRVEAFDIHGEGSFKRKLP